MHVFHRQTENNDWLLLAGPGDLIDTTGGFLTLTGKVTEVENRWAPALAGFVLRGGSVKGDLS